MKTWKEKEWAQRLERNKWMSGRLTEWPKACVCWKKWSLENGSRDKQFESTAAFPWAIKRADKESIGNGAHGEYTFFHFPSISFYFGHFCLANVFSGSLWRLLWHFRHSSIPVKCRVACFFFPAFPLFRLAVPWPIFDVPREVKKKEENAKLLSPSIHSFSEEWPKEQWRKWGVGPKFPLPTFHWDRSINLQKYWMDELKKSKKEFDENWTGN